MAATTLASEHETVEALHELERTLLLATEPPQNAGVCRPGEQAMLAVRSSGVLGVVVPTDYGGMGLDCAAANAIVARIARHDPSLAILLYIHYGVVLRILCWGTDSQRETYLTGAATAGLLMAAAWSEAGRPTTAAATTTATLTASGGWLLDGEKTLTTATGIADVYLVLANVVSEATGGGATHDSPQHNALFVVDSATPGVTPLGILDLVGMSRSSTGSIKFVTCNLSAEAALGAPDTTAAIMRYPQYMGLTLGAVGLGIAARAMDTVNQHITENRWKLTDRQRHHFFRMVCGLEAIRGLVDRCGRTESEDDEDLALIAKVHASEQAEMVCRDAQHVLGAASLMAASPLATLQQDARSIGLMGPNNDACGVIVTKHKLEATSVA